MELHCSFHPAQEKEIAKIVLLHGMGGTGKLWKPVVLGLEHQYSVICPDQRGHGGSRVPAVPGSAVRPGYTPIDYGQDCVDTLIHRNFHPAWIVGHSMGARTACAIAYLKPELCSGIVLVDLGFAGLAGGGFGETLARLLKDLPMEFNSRDEAREYLTERSPDPSIANYLVAVSQPLDPSHPRGPLTFPFDRGALLSTIESARTVSLRNWVQHLGEQSIPTLVLRGSESRVWTHEQFEEEKNLFSQYPNVVFKEIPGTGHGLPFEKRNEFIELLQDFINSDPTY